MSSKLNTKQIELLDLIYRFRFISHITATHLSKETKDSTRYNLTKLKNLKLISKKYKYPRQYYFITDLGFKYLYNKALPRHIRNEKNRSTTFINKCAVRSDLCISLNKLKDIDCEFLTNIDLKDFEYLAEVDPFIYAVFKRENKSIKRTFIEIIQDTLPRYMIKRFVLNYISFYDSYEFESNTNAPFPEVYLLCDSKKIQNYTYKYLVNYKDISTPKFKVILTQKILTNPKFIVK